ncbi:MAG: hypothetical protein WC955_09745 [Elusimicrobiota bacterium]
MKSRISVVLKLFIFIMVLTGTLNAQHQKPFFVPNFGVKFVYTDLKASSVSLVGSFNSWDPMRKQLKKGKNGVWVGYQILTEGKYSYQFIVDGKKDPEPPVDLEVSKLEDGKLKVVTVNAIKETATEIQQKDTAIQENEVQKSAEVSIEIPPENSELPVGALPPQIAAQHVRFMCNYPNAKRVDLVGSFNNWQIGKSKFTKNKSGAWETELKLSPGKYDYQYAVDGKYNKEYAWTLIIDRSVGMK